MSFDRHCLPQIGEHRCDLRNSIVISPIAPTIIAKTVWIRLYLIIGNHWCNLNWTSITYNAMHWLPDDVLWLQWTRDLREMGWSDQKSGHGIVSPDILVFNWYCKRLIDAKCWKLHVWLCISSITCTVIEKTEVTVTGKSPKHQILIHGRPNTCHPMRHNTRIPAMCLPSLECK